MIRFRQDHAPGYCTYSNGYHEIRWDVSGCNLGCLFCWSPKDAPTCDKSPQQVFRDTIDNLADSTKTFIRFTGGEPTLQWQELSKVLRMYDNHPQLGQMPVLIQTNGIEIGKHRVDLSALYTSRRQRYLVELSFKGTNPNEFALLTGREPALYRCQLQAYRTLSQMAQRSCNLCVVAVLGIYHSALKGRSRFAFKGPEGKLLFDNVKSWDPGFRQVWKSENWKWVERLRMSPKGMWDKLVERCGPGGAGILHHAEKGFPTNPDGEFAAKPASANYAKSLVEGDYWG
jgi:uncharacterized Fe-S cluster-containing radical SAM superfamily protein